MISLRNISNAIASAIFASDGNGDLQAIPAGAVGSALVSQGSTALPTFTTPSGSGSSFPAGFIAIWPGTTAPTGWLICDGSEVSRADYASLFALIGTTYGAGDGVNTFLLPDFRGRTPIGYGQGAGLANTYALVQTGGEENTELAITDLPSHKHSYETRTSTTTTTDGANHGWKNTSSPATGSAGSGTAHQNMQPYLAVNFVIKA